MSEVSSAWRAQRSWNPESAAAMRVSMFLRRLVTISKLADMVFSPAAGRAPSVQSRMLHPAGSFCPRNGADCGGGDPQRTSEAGLAAAGELQRSEEHTSELQSLMRISYAVFC